MKLVLDLIDAVSDVISFFKRSKSTSLLIPVFFKGEVLADDTGRTCIVLETHLDSITGIAYTVLQDGVVWPKISASIFSSWKSISEVDQDPFMLMR